MLCFSETPALISYQQEELARKVDWYVSRLLEKDSPYIQVRVLHRMLQDEVTYPYHRLQLEGAIRIPLAPTTLDGCHCGSAYGALVNGKANSYGLARAVQLILTDPRIGIACELVEGCVMDSRRGAISHLWNVVTIDDRSYHVDVTLDIGYNEHCVVSSGEGGRPLSNLEVDEVPKIETLIPACSFCLVSDDVMDADHVWDKGVTARCLSSYKVR